MDSLPVQIVNASPVWLPWLPVFGSFIVAVAALIIGLKANRTNREAIRAADQREHEKWRKDAVTRAGTAILASSQDARSVAIAIVAAYRPALPLQRAPQISPTRVDYTRRSEDLRNACSALTLSAGAGANDAADSLASTHGLVSSAIYALESMVADDYAGWTPDDSGTADPNGLLISSLFRIETYCETVRNSEDNFARAVRIDLGITGPTTNQSVSTRTTEAVLLEPHP